MRQPLKPSAKVLHLVNSLLPNQRALQRKHQSLDEVKMKTPTWQTKAGQNPKGGLNAKGRSSYNAETGGNLKPPVKSGDNPRRASFLARMGGNDGPEYKDGEPTRLLLSLKAWGATSKADAKAKAKAISARNKAKAK
jgi:hypothetical protein